MPSVNVLSPPRFECVACGACCHGVKVALDEGEERDRILRFGEEWGIDGELVDDDGFLVQRGGRCVFIDDDGLCGIHKRHGFDRKPSVCQQFPFVLIHTEEGELRAGVDPGSFHILATWGTEQTLSPPERVVPRRAPLPPDQARAERALVALATAPGMRLAGLASALGGGPPDAGPDLPPGFASRLATLLTRSSLPLVLQAHDVGPPQVAALQPLVELIEGLDPDDPPAWPVLDETAEAYALDLVSRMLYLRLASTIPIVQGVALITLVGAVANAWAAPDHERYGPAMASWTRLMRAGSFWQSLTPTPAAMQWLATGQEPNPFE